MATGSLTGYEPTLGGARAPALLTGNEPMLGGERFRTLAVARLLELLHEPRTTHLRRLTIGRLLAEMGDPRPGVGLRDDDLPDLVWCSVPGGEIFLREYEEPFTVERHFIAKHPVTWAQYRIFLEAPDGHGDLRWWEGLRWRRDYPREAIAIDNHPAQEVSWYDAVAYCRWLSEKLRYEVRLPTEWEWEQAATGGDPRNVFPWGWGWADTLTNTRESGLRRPTAVGMYPGGESPVGALDMSGNVLEWCLNEWHNPRQVAPGPAVRAMRGGSWFQVSSKAYTFFRACDNPYYRFNSVGFRLVTLDPTPKEPPPPPEPIDDPPTADSADREDPLPDPQPPA